jgi:hypothetical protein
MKQKQWIVKTIDPQGNKIEDEFVYADNRKEAVDAVERIYKAHGIHTGLLDIKARVVSREMKLPDDQVSLWSIPKMRKKLKNRFIGHCKSKGESSYLVLMDILEKYLHDEAVNSKTAINNVFD